MHFRKGHLSYLIIIYLIFVCLLPALCIGSGLQVKISKHGMTAILIERSPDGGEALG